MDPPDIFELSPGNGTMSYKAWAFTQTDNFCRVDIKREKSEIAVSMMDQNGEVIRTLKEDGTFCPLPQKLKLTEW